MYASRLDKWIKIAAAGAVLAFCAGAVAVHAATPPPAFETKAKHAMLMDADADLVLFEKDPDTLAPPASMSKLMTLAIVFRELKAGRLKLEDQFKVSEHAWRTGGAPSGGSAMFAPLNSMVTVNDLIQGVTVQSGNNSAIILAEGIGGTEEAFAKQMTEYARTIGLEKSTFANATGLPAEGHLMTVRDLATLARHLTYTYPEYYHFFGQKEFKYREKFTFLNRNPLIFADIGVDGMKTGFIKESGYGMVASAKRGDQRLILVVGGLESAKEREAEARKLLEWGFKSFKPFRLFELGPDGQRRAGVGRHEALCAAGRRRRHQYHLAGKRDRQGHRLDRLSGADQGSHPQGRSSGGAEGHLRRVASNQRDPALCR